MSALNPTPIITLTTWAELALKAVYTSTTETAFDTAFDALFSPHVDVTFNGKKTSRAQFKKELWNEKHNERRGTVDFVGAVEVDKDNKVPPSDGVVGLFLRAAITQATEGRPLLESITASYRLTIIKQDTIHPVGATNASSKKVSVVDVVSRSEFIS